MNLSSSKIDFSELALAYWRLSKWVDRTEAERKMAANSALRQIKQFLQEQNIEIIDFVGQKYDSGLAVDPIGSESKRNIPEEELIIIETVRPAILQNGNVIKYSQVILGDDVKQPSVIKEMPTDPKKAIPIVIDAMDKYCGSDYRDKKIVKKMKWVRTKLFSQMIRMDKKRR